MQRISYCLSVFALLLLIACGLGKNDGADVATKDNGTTTSSKKPKKRKTPFTKSTPSDLGVVHTKFTNKTGEKVKMGDVVSLYMQQAIKDSVLFSTYGKPNPMTFKLQRKLFKGIFNEGIVDMTVGDSAAFYVPVDSLFSKKLPSFAKSGDKIVYTISIEGVKDKK